MGFLKRIFGNKKNKQQKSVEEWSNEFRSELDAKIAEDDKKIAEVQKARNLYKNKKLEEAYRAFEIYFNKNGFKLFGTTMYKDYLNLLYKLKKFDELWAKTNELMLIDSSYSIMAYSFQVKVLKKEKKYTQALLIKLYELILRNISDYHKSLSNTDVHKKLKVLISKTGLNNNVADIQKIIKKYSNSRSLDAGNIKKEYYEIVNNQNPQP